MPKNRTRKTNGHATVLETDEPIIRANVDRQVVTAPTFASLYANDTQVQTTPWDVRLIFGEIAESATKETPVNVIKRVGEVRMSPQHAKVRVSILLKQLAVYERTFGPIPTPPLD